jgi:antitoxin VapB
MTLETPMTITAKLFMSGRSQAIRLPAKLRLAASEVQIEQIGTGLFIRPQPTPDTDMGIWLQGFYASTEALPDDFLATRQDPPAQQRDRSLG